MKRLTPFAISFVVTSTFFINLCSRIFGCGCRALWAGADATCNIHVAHGPHCPWCSHGTTGYLVVMTLLCAPQFAVSVWARGSWPARTLMAVALFPVVGLAVGLVFGWYDKYW